MRIAIFSECYLPVRNGVVTSIEVLRQALEDKGHSVFIFAPGTTTGQSSERSILTLEQRYFGDEHPKFLPLPELPYPRYPFRLARPCPRLPFSFSKLGIDIIHCQHPFIVGRLGAKLAKKYHIPMVYTVHSRYDTMVEMAVSGVLSAIGRPLARLSVRDFCKRANCIVAPSEYMRNALTGMGVRADIRVVPTGVSPLSASRNGRAEIRDRFDLKPGNPLLLYVGRLAPEKRLDLLLNAVAELKRRDVVKTAGNFKLVLVGEGQLRGELMAMVESLKLGDCVTFAGSMSRDLVGDWYAAADIFVFPAPFETQGLVLAEAMQMGVPCIAVAAGGSKEVLRNEVDGLLVSPTAEDLANGIERMLVEPNLRETFAKNAQIGVDRYRPERMAQDILDVYEIARSHKL